MQRIRIVPEDADAMDEWNPDNVALCAARQNKDS